MDQSISDKVHRVVLGGYRVREPGRDAIFERFEDRMEEVIDITKIRLLGAAKWVFGTKLEKFPMMEFADKKTDVKASGLIIADNFSDSLIKGVFTSPYDTTAAKIIPHGFNELTSLVFSGEKLFLHNHDKFSPDLEGREAPQDFYLAFARAVMGAIEQEAKRRKDVE
ncbi:hypothetical protein A3C73_04465 [Candidatus Giovannonibacteria bacterium RIFCSPHIGHO2_02_FULL_44_11]|nr:MAG: hypothetical protein A3C73_04465 [Candidatus Giovannonibacteria bacterium RIFCSPHIGHO2_02_FULL_44_11]